MNTNVSRYLHSLFSIEGKVAVITGASGGLGRSLSQALASAGATTVLVARSEAALQTLSASLEEQGITCSLLPCDLSDVDKTREMIATVVERFGSIDVLVNCAGSTAMTPSLDMTEEQWDRVLNLNLKATFFASQAAARFMKQRGGGRIINVSSVAGSMGFPGRASYVSSKGGVSALTRTLAAEWASDRVYVNAIAPGFFRTNINEHLFADADWAERLQRRIPLGRPGTPSELEGMVVYLASDASSYVVGQTLYVDGGYLCGDITLNVPED